MKSSIWVTGLVALGVIGAGAAFSGLFRESGRLTSYVSSRGLEKPVQKVGVADARLTDRISTRLGLSSPPDPEIDLANPTEQDIQFLIETFQGNEPTARRSAARALIIAQQPRAVGLLVRAAGTPEELAYYCSGALEILRYRTREEAAELMIDVLSDLAHPPSASCRADLEGKLSFIRGSSPETLVALLTSDKGRVRLYALEHLPSLSDPDVRQTIQELANGKQPEEARLARKWLERPVPEKDISQDDTQKAVPAPAAAP